MSACFWIAAGFGQAWDYTWAVGIGSPEDDDDGVHIAVDSEDNVYMAVEVEGAVTLGGVNYPAPADEGRDVLVVKISPSGEVLWSGSIAGDGFSTGILFGDQVDGIHVDQDDNLVVIGNIGSNGTVFGAPNGISENRNYIIKIGSDGQVLWEVYADESFLNDEFTSITSDENGDYYLTTRAGGGSYSIGGVQMTDIQTSQAFRTLTKISPSGVVQFVQEIPTAVPTQVQFDSNGNYIVSSQYGENGVTGYAMHKFSATDFSTIWERETVGSGQNNPQGGNLGFHVKSDGSIVQFLKNGSSVAYADADPIDCDTYCGMGILVNIDADGNTVSTHTFESIIENPQELGLTGLNFFPTSFEVIDDDTYYIAGRLQGDVQFSNGFLFQPSEWYLAQFDIGEPSDAFVVKVDGDLNLLEYSAGTGSSLQRGLDVSVFSNGDAALAGIYLIETFGGFTGNTVFGAHELAGFGGEDYFVTRVVTGSEAPLSFNNNYESFAFDLFPNPSGDFTNLRFTLSDAREARIEVFDLTGKILKTERIGGAGSVEYRMDTSDLVPGMYTLRLITDNSAAAKVFVVNR